MTYQAPQFSFDYEFEYGVVSTVAPGIRRVVARNPSAFTFQGTGTYIVGEGEVAVIDAGPRIEAHVDAILAALPGETVTHILVTHTHTDHSPASALLKERTGAATYGFGAHGAGRYLRGNAVEEGADWDFTPDVAVSHGQIIEGDNWSFECVHTPGHTSNHVCYQYRETRALFSGDHVMGWSTTIVAPPDGDMTQYLVSLEGMLLRDDTVYWPTHGPCIEPPAAYVRSLIEHRIERQKQILECLHRGIRTINDMVGGMYPHLDQSMHGAAAIQILSAMVHLHGQDQVGCDGEPSLDASYFVLK